MTVPVHFKPHQTQITTNTKLNNHNKTKEPLISFVNKLVYFPLFKQPAAPLVNNLVWVELGPQAIPMLFIVQSRRKKFETRNFTDDALFRHRNLPPICMRFEADDAKQYF